MNGYGSVKAAGTIIGLAVLLLGGSDPNAAGGGNQGFGFNANRVEGFSGGRAVELTGGGVYRPDRNDANSGGGFRCLSNILAGPFTGCQNGEGVRWDTAALLTATPFQCTGSDLIKTAHTDDQTVVLVADFYRQGDGTIESFTAKMVVSALDLDPVAAGVQNVWVQGIGCATDAVTSFN